MGKLKYSRQRESIEAFLKTRYDHPTADIVYQHIREEYPNISLGTVYRNLSLLASLGRLKIINCGDGVEHFDADTSKHYHFKCLECGGLLDIEADFNNELKALASKQSGFTVTGYNLVFEGFCKDCTSNQLRSNQSITNLEYVGASEI